MTALQLLGFVVLAAIPAVAVPKTSIPQHLTICGLVSIVAYCFLVTP